MGYPLTWKRLVHRHRATGGYDGAGEYGDDIGAPQWAWMEPERFRERPRDPVRPEVTNHLAGDMRRLEADQRDDRHLAEYAKRAGITPEQARAVLDAFFTGDF
jgi:hypothetical protein